MTKPIIVLDPGHGSTKGVRGFDSGAVYGVRTEAEANLEAALTLKHLLIQSGWDVRLTHDGTQGAKPDLNTRVRMAAQVGAVALISIHYDMVFTPPRHQRGVYHAPGVASFALAKQLQRALGRGAWVRPSSSSRFLGLYIDSFPDSRPAVMLELDSIQYAPDKAEGDKRVAMLTPIAAVLNTLKPAAVPL